MVGHEKMAGIPNKAAHEKGLAMYLRYSKCEDARANVSEGRDYLLTFTQIITPSIFRVLWCKLTKRPIPENVDGENIIVYGTNLNGWKYVDGKPVRGAIRRFLKRFGPGFSFVDKENFFDITMCSFGMNWSADKKIPKSFAYLFNL